MEATGRRQEEEDKGRKTRDDQDEEKVFQSLFKTTKEISNEYPLDSWHIPRWHAEPNP
jgi:hypothetical protein